ncbi:MAG: hypothetical protein PHS17_01045, partial [Desulfobacterales bacterium]|nr:hypothetical protein [Desulfobacterales bacterium]
MSQGPHTFTATAVDSAGVSHSSEATIIIDNTPTVGVGSLGRVEGAFDISGSASFKERISGHEGTVSVGYGLMG